MNHPLTDYFIYCSSKTFLEKACSPVDAHKVSSKIEMIDFALKKGCRGIELDVYEGKNGTFFVGMNNSIVLEDALKCICDNGFTVSQFPIFLTIENYCSEKSSADLASVIQSQLSDKLYIPIPEIRHSLPSPEQLKNKIVLLGVHA